MRGEPLGPGHERELATLMLDPRVGRTLWATPAPPTMAEIGQALRDKRAHWERHGFGLWLLWDRHGGGLVGRGGLQRTDAGGAGGVEVAWAIVPERWGQGLATELAHACVRVAFDDLQLGELVAITLPDNVASRRVMEKAGFRYRRPIRHAGLEHVLYALARAAVRPRSGRCDIAAVRGRC